MSETSGNKFVRKIKEDPVVPIGIIGMLATCAVGAYKYKSARKVMSTSNFLMQLRVTAQTAVVGCICLGMAYNLGKTLLFKEEAKKE